MKGGGKNECITIQGREGCTYFFPDGEDLPENGNCEPARWKNQTGFFCDGNEPAAPAASGVPTDKAAEKLGDSAPKISAGDSPAEIARKAEEIARAREAEQKAAEGKGKPDTASAETEEDQGLVEKMRNAQWGLGIGIASLGVVGAIAGAIIGWNWESDGPEEAAAAKPAEEKPKQAEKPKAADKPAAPEKPAPAKDAAPARAEAAEKVGEGAAKPDVVSIPVHWKADGTAFVNASDVEDTLVPKYVFLQNLHNEILEMLQNPKAMRSLEKQTEFQKKFTLYNSYIAGCVMVAQEKAESNAPSVDVTLGEIESYLRGQNEFGRMVAGASHEMPKPKPQALAPAPSEIPAPAPGTGAEAAGGGAQGTGGAGGGATAGTGGAKGGSGKGKIKPGGKSKPHSSSKSKGSGGRASAADLL